MHPMVWRVLAVAAGLAVAVLMVGLVEGLSSRFHPLPAGIDYNDRAAMTAAISALPATAFVAVLAAWGLGALAGAYAATRIGRHAGSGYLIGVLIGAGAVANLLMIPHPVWMWAGAAIVVPLATLAGVRMACAPVGAVAAR
jgi:hypothetical protein